MPWFGDVVNSQAGGTTSATVSATWPAGARAGMVFFGAVFTNSGAVTLNSLLGNNVAGHDWSANVFSPVGALPIAGDSQAGNIEAWGILRQLTSQDILDGNVLATLSAAGRCGFVGSLYTVSGSWQTPPTVTKVTGSTLTAPATFTHNHYADVACVALTRNAALSTFPVPTIGTGFTTRGSSGTANASSANLGGGTGDLTALALGGTSVGGQSISATNTPTQIIAYLVELDPVMVNSPPVQPGKTWLRRFRHRQIPPLYDTPAGATSVNLTGQVSPITLAAPAGAVALSVNLTGAVSPLVLASPAGSLNLSVNLTAAPATLVLAAPAGALNLSVNLTGAVSPIALAAPAGSINLSVNLTAAPAPIVLAAPAGTVTTTGSVNLTGAVSALALAAPAGTVSTVTNVAGALSAFTLTAFAGTVAATTTTVTYKFVSPLTYTVKDTANKFWDRFAQQRSKSILKFGAQYQTVIGPSAEQVEAADVTYLGGHEYKITAAEAAALTAAGYGAGVTTS